MGLKVLEIGSFIGSNKVDNSGYFEHFKSQGQDVQHFFEDVMGRDQRCLATGENSLTMAVKATQDALNKNQLKGDDLDIIIFSSSLPEYVVPPTSFLLHNLIQGKEKAFCIDMNANCAGMICGLELVKSLLVGNTYYKRALIVGCDYLNLTADPSNECCFGHYGDAACALIVEKTGEPSDILSFTSLIDNFHHDKAAMPRQGFSGLLEGETVNKEDLLVDWKRFSAPIENFASNQITQVLEENNLTIEDIAAVCLSQFSVTTINKIKEIVSIDDSKIIYIGDKIGYTGTSSPFLAMDEGIRMGKIKRGDYVLFWTIGMGAEAVCALVRY